MSRLASKATLPRCSENQVEVNWNNEGLLKRDDKRDDKRNDKNDKRNDKRDVMPVREFHLCQLKLPEAKKSPGLRGQEVRLRSVAEWEE